MSIQVFEYSLLINGEEVESYQEDTEWAFYTLREDKGVLSIYRHMDPP